MIISSEKIVKFSAALYIIYYGLPIMNCLPSVIRVLFCYFIIFLFLTALLIGRSGNNNIIWGMIVAIALFDMMLYYGEGIGMQGVGLEQKSRSLFMFWLPFLQGLYFISKKSDVRRLIRFFLVIMFVTCITTVIGVFFDPMATRMLAKSSAVINKTDYYLRNIGGYGYIYSLVFLIPVLEFCKRSIIDSSQKLFISIFEVLGVICLILSQYTTALILLLIELPYLVSKRLKFKNYVITMSLILLFVFFILDFGVIINQVMKLLQGFDLDVISNRLQNVYNVIVNGVSEGDVYKRFQLYLSSWNSFVNSPLLGNLGKTEFHTVGGHSDILDLLGGTGVTGMLYSILIFKGIFKRYILKIIPRSNSERYLQMALFVFLVLACFNTVFVAHQISLVITFGVLLLQNLGMYSETADASDWR